MAISVLVVLSSITWSILLLFSAAVKGVLRLSASNLVVGLQVVACNTELLNLLGVNSSPVVLDTDGFLLGVETIVLLEIIFAM